MEISAITLQGPVVPDDCELNELEQETNRVAKKVFAELPRQINNTAEFPRQIKNAEFPRQIKNAEFPRQINDVESYTPPGC